MHDQIEQENKDKLNKYFDEFGGLLRYKADNMGSVFKPGDMLYIITRRFPIDGDIAVIRQENRLTVCRINKSPEGYILTDDKNPPQIVDAPDIVGSVIGYERMF